MANPETGSSGDVPIDKEEAKEIMDEFKNGIPFEDAYDYEQGGPDAAEGFLPRGGADDDEDDTES